MNKENQPPDIYQVFRDEVNLSAAEPERWLKTDESKAVGQDSGDGRSIGHRSGEHIVRILHQKKTDLTPADEAHLPKVHAYISRHPAQRPSGNVEHTPWRYPLMNWGHDPLK